MTSWVALLRGVNVGGRNQMPMAELRELFVSLGYEDARTYIQSGNVLFGARSRVDPAALEKALAGRFGFEVPVVLRSAAELAAALEADPFPRAARSALHVGFMGTEPDPAAVAGVDAGRYAPEEFAVVGRDLYLHLPSGLGRAKLPPAVVRKLGVPTTLRNWNTVTKLADMAAAGTT